MPKRVYIIHGWEGYPEEGWFPWLKLELEAKGFEVHVPQMPDADNPRIQNWVPAITEIVSKPDINTYFVGHSMGCQVIARYIESLPEGIKVGGAVFVAGFFKRLIGLEDDPAVQETDKHWLEAPIDLVKVKKHLKNSVAVFSDNDPFVPLDNSYDFKDKLDSRIIVQHEMGHFSGPTDHVTELPVVLEELLKMVPVSSKF